MVAARVLLDGPIRVVDYRAPELMVLGELAQATAGGTTDLGLDEAALLFVGRFAELARPARRSSSRSSEPSALGRRRAVEVALWIDAHCDDEISLASAGGKDNGKPGLRADYSPTYHAAFLIDPDGNNVEAVCLA